MGKTKESEQGVPRAAICEALARRQWRRSAVGASRTGARARDPDRRIGSLTVGLVAHALSPPSGAAGATSATWYATVVDSPAVPSWPIVAAPWLRVGRVASPRAPAPLADDPMRQALRETRVAPPPKHAPLAPLTTLAVVHAIASRPCRASGCSLVPSPLLRTTPPQHFFWPKTRLVTGAQEERLRGRCVGRDVRVDVL